MPTHSVIIPYTPRPQLIAYHDRAERFAKIVAHRRFGKTVGCINDQIKAALSNTRRDPPPRYAYVAPTYAQAKDIAWAYLKHYSAPLPNLRISESELWVEYIMVIYFGKVVLWDKVLSAVTGGSTDPITGDGAAWAGMIMAFYMGKRGFENVAAILRAK